MTTRATYLTAHHLDLVRIFWTPYLEAVGIVGLPEAAAFSMGGLHYEESEFSGVSPKGEHGGGLCFDPAGRGYAGTLDQQIAFHVKQVRKRYGLQGPDPSIETDFRTAALVAADELKEKWHPAPLTRGEWPAIREHAAWAMWGYNGRSEYDTEWHRRQGRQGTGGVTHSWRWSPYVSSDPKNGVSLYTASGTEVGTDGGRTEIKGGVVKQDPGALIVADELHARWRDWWTGPMSPAA